MSLKSTIKNAGKQVSKAAGVVLPIAGAAAGYAVGGPAGAAIGGAIGGGITGGTTGAVMGGLGGYVGGEYLLGGGLIPAGLGAGGATLLGSGSVTGGGDAGDGGANAYLQQMNEQEANRLAMIKQQNERAAALEAERRRIAQGSYLAGYQDSTAMSQRTLLGVSA